MSDRITTKDIEAVCSRINRTVNGEDRSPWERNESGELRAVIGTYTLDGAYGGYALYRIMNEGGGVNDVLQCGHLPKREIYNMMRSFLAGFEARS